MRHRAEREVTSPDPMFDKKRMDDLVRLVVAVDDLPTIPEVEKMITVLRQKPRCEKNSALMDALLDLRSGLLADLAA